MPSIELAPDRQATFQVIGQGIPALMLPGGPGFSSSYMRGTAELFADLFQSHLVDPHGSGGSTAPRDQQAYSPEGHAQFFEDVRLALGLPQVTVFGHSFGATTALAYSALYPDSVARCIAVAPFGIGTERDEDEGGSAAAEMETMLARHVDAPWYEQARLTWDNWTERVLATHDAHEVDQMMATVLPLYTAHPERPEVAWGLEEFSRDLRSDLDAIKAWEGGLYQGIDLRPLLGQIGAPTLVVAGQLDLLCDPAQAIPISEAVADSTLVIIPDCGHIPSIEAPDRFKSEILAWISSH